MVVGVGDLVAELFEELGGDTDLVNEEFAEEWLGIDGAVAVFEGGEGDCACGGDGCWACGFAGLCVES